MKDQVLQEMISDPEFDPIKWLGWALKFYVEKNPSKVVDDPVCRQYILRAMEPDDWSSIGRVLPPDEKAISTWISKVVNTSADDNRNRRRAESTILDLLTRETVPTDRLYEPFRHLLLNFRGFSKPPNKQIVYSYSEMQLREAVEKWDHSKWDREHWRLVISRLGSQLTSAVMNPEFPDWLVQDLGRRSQHESKAEAKQRVRQSPNVQDVLAYVIQRLPDGDLHLCSELLARFTPDKLYRMYYDYYEHVRGERYPVQRYDDRVKRKQLIKSRSGGSRYSYGWHDNEYEYVDYKPKFNDLMCRCGYMASNSSAYTNHYKKCGWKGYLPLSVLARLEHARRGNAELICPNCAKECSTSSGMTLHKKRCKNKILSKD